MFDSNSAAWESRRQHLCVFPPTSAWLYGCWSIEHMLRHRSRSPCRLGQSNQTILRGFPLPSHYTSFPPVFAIAPPPNHSPTHPIMTTSSCSRSALCNSMRQSCPDSERAFSLWLQQQTQIRSEGASSDVILETFICSQMGNQGVMIWMGGGTWDENPRGEISKTELST